MKKEPVYTFAERAAGLLQSSRRELARYQQYDAYPFDTYAEVLEQFCTELEDAGTDRKKLVALLTVYDLVAGNEAVDIRVRTQHQRCAAQLSALLMRDDAPEIEED